MLCPLPDPAQIIPKSVSITHKESVISNQLPIIWTVEVDLRIAKKYRLVSKIGAGVYGMVYRGKLTAYHIFNATLLINIKYTPGIDTLTNKEVAIKLEDGRVHQTLHGEYLQYKKMDGGRKLSLQSL